MKKISQLSNELSKNVLNTSQCQQTKGKGRKKKRRKAKRSEIIEISVPFPVLY